MLRRELRAWVRAVENWPAQVDSFEIDGNTVAGTATFVVNFAFGGEQEPQSTPGTFRDHP